VATVATTVTITDNESTNESNALIFTAGGDVDGGNIGLESDGTLTYNPSTGKVTATGFVGALTGAVTGNVAGNLTGTVATATQNSITTMTGLTTSGALGAGSIAAGFGAIDNGTSGIRSNTIIAETAFVPDDNDGADLGTTALGFSNLMIADEGRIRFGNDQDVILTHVHNGGLLLNSTNTISFNDASQNIGAPSNAILDINATDEIELNATLVDINANVEISGTSSAGNTTVTGTYIQNAGNFTFNEDSADVDFRVESNGNTHMLFVDGGANKVGIGKANVPADLLHLRGGTGNDSAEAAIIRIEKISGGAVTDGQTIGGMSFWVNDDGVNSGAVYERAKIIAESQNTSSGTRLEFWTGNSNAAIAERVRITADGTVVAPLGVCLGVAIDGQAASNTLDDYEEGAWTVVLNNTGGTPNYTWQVGHYTKVGNLVHLTANVKMVVTPSGNTQIAVGGLPFANRSGTGQYVGAEFQPKSGFNYDGDGLTAQIYDGSSIAYLEEHDAGTGGNSSSFLANEVGDGSNEVTVEFRFNAFYTT